jgi:hypothetical protein
MLLGKSKVLWSAGSTALGRQLTQWTFTPAKETHQRICFNAQGFLSPTGILVNKNIRIFYFIPIIKK